jgi:hypothetical protein
MIQFKDYVAGWLAGSINDFIKVFPKQSRTMEYALISRLDSESDIVSLRRSCKELGFLADNGRFVGKGLLVPTRRLREVNSEHQVFLGFDEVFFFPTDQIQPKPESASLVGPNRVTQRRMNVLGNWLVTSSCSLALGDGVGLNFIVKARGLVRHMLSFSLEQPEPTLRHSFEQEPWDPQGIGL